MRFEETNPDRATLDRQEAFGDEYDRWLDELNRRFIGQAEQANESPAVARQMGEAA